MAFKINDLVVSNLDGHGVGTVMSVTEDHAFVVFTTRKNVWCHNEDLKKYADWEYTVEQVQQEIDPSASYAFPTFSETTDAVDSPSHYNNGSIECIDYLKDNLSWEGYTGYLEGNCKKYLHRWRHKQKPLEDLKKARWYLDRLISELEQED